MTARAARLSDDTTANNMNSYLISLCAGILIGVFYALFRVRSPAPPGIALIGLLGMVLGERLIPVLGHLLAG